MAVRIANPVDMVQKKYPAIRNHHSPNMDCGFVPKVKRRVGASGLRMKNLPRRNIPARQIEGSRSEVSIHKIGHPETVVEL